jgi:hypothetical protein
MTKTEKVNQLHEQAMQLAEEAFLAKRSKDEVTAKKLYCEAYHLEEQAALLMITDYTIEPTRSVLFKGAASLAVSAGLYQEAERMIRFALLGNPPSPLEQELYALLLNVQQSPTTEAAISKFQSLPEELQKEVANFIDFLAVRHQVSLSEASV